MDYATSRAPAKNDRNAWAEPGVEDLGGGVHRIPLPLPGDALTAVNVYVITGDAGVDLIDSGMALPQAREELTGALGRLGYGLGDIRNFFITHIHRDHYTLAVQLRTTLRGRITLGEAERANMAAIRDVSAGRAGVGFVEMLPAMGAADLAADVSGLLGPRLADPQPRLEWSDPDHWLPDGALIELPGRTLRAIHTPGHTSGHVVFQRRGGKRPVRRRRRAAAHHPVDRVPAGDHPAGARPVPGLAAADANTARHAAAARARPGPGIHPRPGPPAPRTPRDPAGTDAGGRRPGPGHRLRGGQRPAVDPQAAHAQRPRHDEPAARHRRDRRRTWRSWSSGASSPASGRPRASTSTASRPRCRPNRRRSRPAPRRCRRANDGQAQPRSTPAGPNPGPPRPGLIPVHPGRA